MLFQRDFAFKLYPDSGQEALLRQGIGVCRLVYNLALEQRRDHYRNFERATGSKLRYVAQARELTALRREFDWIAAVSQTAQQQALRDLDRAFQNFFSGRSRYPTPRKRELHDRVPFQGRECEVTALNAKWATVKLPKVGWVKFRRTRDLPGVLKNVTVSLKAGLWQVTCCCEYERAVGVHPGPAVGGDLGVANSITVSTGKTLSLPTERINVLKRQHKRAQRAVARGQRGSNRNRRHKQKTARISARVARVRRHGQHEISKGLAETFSVVVFEDLKIRNMTASAKGTPEEPGRNVRQKAVLNRAVLDQGWGEIVSQTTYKLEECGGYTAFVDPRGTSQECSSCGHRDPENRKSQAEFRCVACGHDCHADVNAARNILRRWNTPLLDVDGSCIKHPDEASTRKVAA